MEKADEEKSITKIPVISLIYFSVYRVVT
jgi:hypothetical protein